MPSIAVIPDWVSIASPLRYFALVAGTSKGRRNNAEVMAMSFNLLAAIASTLEGRDRKGREETQEGGQGFDFMILSLRTKG